MRCAIGVILQPLDLCRYSILGTLEIDYAIVLPVPTTDVPSCNPSIIVAAAIPGLILQQRTIGCSLVQIIIHDPDDVATTWGSGLAL
jgi:hypothetical protein